jgi:hypothetical protein
MRVPLAGRSCAKTRTSKEMLAQINISIENPLNTVVDQKSRDAVHYYGIEEEFHSYAQYMSNGVFGRYEEEEEESASRGFRGGL